MPFYAHTANDSNKEKILDKSKWQLLSHHAEEVAKLAADFLKNTPWSKTGRLLGMLHDLGKYQDQFQNYLKDKSSTTPHAWVGAGMFYQNHKWQSPLMANCIAGHHMGLQNWTDDYAKELEDKLISNSTVFETCWKTFKDDSDKKLTKPQSFDELSEIDREIATRIIFSALVDADFLDTERHFRETEGKPINPYLPIAMTELSKRLRKYVSKFKQENSIDKIRTQLFKKCFSQGVTTESGIFSLTIPTGGGKTLSSLAFALEHAIKHKFERIIYVIPYTSIIEQNAKVISGALGEGVVLEHHSLAEWRRKSDNSDKDEITEIWEKRASENWNAEVIVTTNVQFFESLMSNRTSACRKVHRLLDAVIIFDECQTFPSRLLNPTLKRLNALVEIGRTSLVFCTATQPAFKKSLNLTDGFENMREIIPESMNLSDHAEFQRTRIIKRNEPSPLSIESFCEELIEKEKKSGCAFQVLAVFNTRKSAQAAWRQFRDLSNNSDGVFHLSTLMCPMHRLEVLAEIKMRLKTQQRCITFSTQLIEAGVDVDFPLAYRSKGPLDSIIQTAGRCNRNSESKEPLPVFVVEIENDKIVSDNVYTTGTNTAFGLLHDEQTQVSANTIQKYFRLLYNSANLDAKTIERSAERLQFKQIARDYRWIENDDSYSVLAPWSEKGKKLILELCNFRDLPPDRKLQRQMGPYSINLRSSVIREACNNSLIQELSNGCFVTENVAYNKFIGFNNKAIALGNIL